MFMTKRAATLAAALILMPLSAFAAGEGHYITRAQIDLTRILPPPPAQDGPVTKAELAETLELQTNAGKERIDQAAADAEETIFRFAYKLFPELTPEKAPLAAAFFKKVIEDEDLIVDVAKDVWKRPRPFLADERIKALAKRTTSGSYPSGHTTVGTLLGVILAEMVPEKRVEIFARTEDYGFSRMVAGLHYRSDLFASRMAGTAMVAIMMQNDAFKKDAAAVKAEIRKAIGLAN